MCRPEPYALACEVFSHLSIQVAVCQSTQQSMTRCILSHGIVAKQHRTSVRSSCPYPPRGLKPAAQGILVSHRNKSSLPPDRLDGKSNVRKLLGYLFWPFGGKNHYETRVTAAKRSNTSTCIVGRATIMTWLQQALSPSHIPGSGLVTPSDHSHTSCTSYASIA